MSHDTSDAWSMDEFYQAVVETEPENYGASHFFFYRQLVNHASTQAFDR